MRGHGRPYELSCLPRYDSNLLRSRQACYGLLKLPKIRRRQLWTKDEAPTQHAILRTNDRPILAVYFQYLRHNRSNRLRRHASRQHVCPIPFLRRRTPNARAYNSEQGRCRAQPSNCRRK